MVTSAHSYPAARRPTRSSLVPAILRRVPLVMMTVVFTLISFRNLSNTVAAAAAVGISFTSPEGITILRVGFGAFPLALAILACVSLVSARWRLAGLYMVLTVDSVVIAVRALSIVTVHSAASARLFAPEAVLLILSMVAIRLESGAIRGSNPQEGRQP